MRCCYNGGPLNLSVFRFSIRMKKLTALSLAVSLFAASASASAADAPVDANRKTLPSGVQMLWLKSGTGASPAATSAVTVHYRGTLTNGTEFDSSYKRGQPISFPLNRVVPCWTQALQAMRIGDKTEVVCPPSMAYGDRGVPGAIPPNAILKFEVELLAILP